MKDLIRIMYSPGADAGAQSQADMDADAAEAAAINDANNSADADPGPVPPEQPAQAAPAAVKQPVPNPVPAVPQTAPPHETGIAATQPQAPAYLANEKAEGIDGLAKFKRPPRIVLVQPQSKSERKAMFGGEGVVGLMPAGVPVALMGEEFVVAPLAFFPTWEKRSDYNDTGADFILDQSFDEHSEIAKKSRSKNTRNEKYGDSGFEASYVESLNFIVAIESGDCIGEVGIVSFSGGEHHTGIDLCDTIDRRGHSIFANRFSFKSKLRQRTGTEWYGYDINNPTEEQGGAFADKPRYDELTEIHKGLMHFIESRTIVLDPDDGGSGEAPSDGANTPDL